MRTDTVVVAGTLALAGLWFAGAWWLTRQVYGLAQPQAKAPLHPAERRRPPVRDPDVRSRERRAPTRSISCEICAPHPCRCEAYRLLAEALTRE